MRHFHVSLVLALIGMDAHAAETCRAGVSISVTVTPIIAPDKPPALSIKITNTDTGPPKLPYWPWAGPGQIRLVAMLLPSGGSFITSCNPFAIRSLARSNWHQDSMTTCACARHPSSYRSGGIEEGGISAQS